MSVCNNKASEAAGFLYRVVRCGLGQGAGGRGSGAGGAYLYAGDVPPLYAGEAP